MGAETEHKSGFKLTKDTKEFWGVYSEDCLKIDRVVVASRCTGILLGHVGVGHSGRHDGQTVTIDQQSYQHTAESDSTAMGGFSADVPIACTGHRGGRPVQGCDVLCTGSGQVELLHLALTDGPTNDPTVQTTPGIGSRFGINSLNPG